MKLGTFVDHRAGPVSLRQERPAAASRGSSVAAGPQAAGAGHVARQGAPAIALGWR